MNADTPDQAADKLDEIKNDEQTLTALIALRRVMFADQEDFDHSEEAEAACASGLVPILREAENAVASGIPLGHAFMMALLLSWEASSEAVSGGAVRAITALVAASGGTARVPIEVAVQCDNMDLVVRYDEAGKSLVYTVREHEPDIGGDSKAETEPQAPETLIDGE